MTLTLGFHNRWTTNHLIFVKWSLFSKAFLFKAYLRLLARFKKVLSPNCTHIKNHGGLKTAIRYLKKSLFPGYFFARFDIQSYYRSIDHKVLLKILQKYSTPVELSILRV